MFLTKTKEKRRQLRVKPDKKEPIRIDINGENFIEILHVYDISSGGACIIVPHMFENCKINKNISVVLTLPEPVKESILVLGKIKHTIRNKFGISFFDLSRKNKKKIRDYISSRLEGYPFFTKLMYNLRII